MVAASSLPYCHWYSSDTCDMFLCASSNLLLFYVGAILWSSSTRVMMKSDEAPSWQRFVGRNCPWSLRTKNAAMTMKLEYDVVWSINFVVRKFRRIWSGGRRAVIKPLRDKAAFMVAVKWWMDDLWFGLASRSSWEAQQKIWKWWRMHVYVGIHWLHKVYPNSVQKYIRLSGHATNSYVQRKCTYGCLNSYV